jgi:flagellar biosynthetic protein FlhB
VADKDGKTEKPTQKKIRDARKEGQFPRTPDAATWLGIAGGAALLPFTARLVAKDTAELFGWLPQIAVRPTPDLLLRALSEVPTMILVGAAPMCLGALAGAVLGTAAQGVHVSGKAMKFKANRLSPKEGIKRMFGPRAAWEAVKALLKVTAVAVVVWVLGRSLVPELLGQTLPLGAVAERAKDGLETLLWSAVVVGLLLALADYAVQRRTVMKQLMMTPREIKDEVKQTEGDPMVKGAIRSRQMAMSRNRMLSAVADADVVLVNPTHFAVALKYEPVRGAPRVVAKGAGALALKIREKAREAKVPIVEDKPLTRTLYRVCDLGDEIPSELYMAVARILAFVMAAGRPGGAAARRPGPSKDLPDLPTKSQLRTRRAREQREARAGSRA